MWKGKPCNVVLWIEILKMHGCLIQSGKHWSEQWWNGDPYLYISYFYLLCKPGILNNELKLCICVCVCVVFVKYTRERIAPDFVTGSETLTCTKIILWPFQKKKKNAEPWS